MLELIETENARVCEAKTGLFSDGDTTLKGRWSSWGLAGDCVLVDIKGNYERESSSDLVTGYDEDRCSRDDRRSTRTGSSKRHSIERTLLPLRGRLNVQLVHLVGRLGKNCRLCWALRKEMTVGRPQVDGKGTFAYELMGREMSGR